MLDNPVSLGHANRFLADAAFYRCQAHRVGDSGTRAHDAEDPLLGDPIRFAFQIFGHEFAVAASSSRARVRPYSGHHLAMND